MHVELLKTHTHVGIVYPPLSVIAIDDDLAQWLIEAGIARIATESTKPIPRHEEKSK
jgi:hypothetical protein